VPDPIQPSSLRSGSTTCSVQVRRNRCSSAPEPALESVRNRCSSAVGISVQVVPEYAIDRTRGFVDGTDHPAHRLSPAAPVPAVASATEGGHNGSVQTRHFLSLRQWGRAAITETLDRAEELARLWRLQRMPQTLRSARVGLWFYGDGFRNRLAFEVGAREMGASVAYVPGELGVHEPLEDIAGYLGNWFTLLVLRAKRHDDLMAVAAASRIPVINARTDRSHPCEILGDLSYLRGWRGDLDGLRVAFVGEASNVCMSWLEAAAVLPMSVVQVCPPGHGVAPHTLAELRQGAAGTIEVEHDLQAALAGVDLIYTDCWPKASTPDEQATIRREFLPYQIKPEHLGALSERGIFLPCPPVTRGEEVCAEAMRSQRCHNHVAKDHLLHVQNAILEALAAVLLPERS
jgi:ornithine carbamoyltransferase